MATGFPVTLDSRRDSLHRIFAFKHKGLIMNTPFAKSTTDAAQALRADYAAPTLSLLFVQSTENSLGKSSDGVTVGTSNLG